MELPFVNCTHKEPVFSEELNQFYIVHRTVFQFKTVLRCSQSEKTILGCSQSEKCVLKTSESSLESQFHSGLMCSTNSIKNVQLGVRIGVPNGPEHVQQRSVVNLRCIFVVSIPVLLGNKNKISL
jgi:hypothetical protein